MDEYNGLGGNFQMRDLVQGLEKKFDRVVVKTGEMNGSIVRLTVILEEHEKRSIILRDDFKRHKERTHEKIGKLETFMFKIVGGWKFVIMIGIIIGIFVAYLKVRST